MTNTQSHLRKGRNKMLTGVAAGVAEYAGLDPTLVRLAFVLLTLAGGPGRGAGDKGSQRLGALLGTGATPRPVGPQLRVVR